MEKFVKNLNEVNDADPKEKIYVYLKKEILSDNSLDLKSAIMNQ